MPSQIPSSNCSHFGLEKNYNILFALIIFPFLRMHRSEPLTVDQIAQLRNEVSKLLQANMDSFATRASRATQLLAQDFHALYDFSEEQHQRAQRILQSLADFAFSVLSNAQLIWEEVHHREGKLLQLRQSLAAATAYVEELRGENEELRGRLEEAETYIQWMEEEKECLDAIYYDRSQTTTATHHRPFLRCVSERTLQYNEDYKRRTPSYQKLKGYIEVLKQQRNQIQRQLILLANKYEVKCEDARKANALVEHLVQRLNQKNERKDFLEALSSSQARETRNDLSDDLLRLLEKTEQQTTNSVRQNTSLFEEEPFLPPRPVYHYFESFTHLPQRLNSIPIQKETRDIATGTDSFPRRAAACQTQWQDGGIPSIGNSTINVPPRHELPKNDNKGDLRISICVGGDSPQQEQVVKIISELHIEREIQARLRGGEKSEGKTADSGRISTINRTLLSTYEYYRNRLVASRIKKYRFSKPDPAPARPRPLH